MDTKDKMEHYATEACAVDKDAGGSDADTTITTGSHEYWKYQFNWRALDINRPVVQVHRDRLLPEAQHQDTQAMPQGFVITTDQGSEEHYMFCEGFEQEDKITAFHVVKGYTTADSQLYHQQPILERQQ